MAAFPVMVVCSSEKYWGILDMKYLICKAKAAEVVFTLLDA